MVGNPHQYNKRGSGQATTEGGDGKATAVHDGGGNTASKEHITENITHCKTKVKIVGNTERDKDVQNDNKVKNTDGKHEMFAH